MYSDLLAECAESTRTAALADTEAAAIGLDKAEEQRQLREFGNAQPRWRELGLGQSVGNRKWWGGHEAWFPTRAFQAPTNVVTPPTLTVPAPKNFTVANAGCANAELAVMKRAAIAILALFEFNMSSAENAWIYTLERFNRIMSKCTENCLEEVGERTTGAVLTGRNFE